MRGAEDLLSQMDARDFKRHNIIKYATVRHQATTKAAGDASALGFIPFPRRMFDYWGADSN